VSAQAYADWLTQAQKKFAAIPPAGQLADASPRQQ